MPFHLSLLPTNALRRSWRPVLLAGGLVLSGATAGAAQIADFASWVGFEHFTVAVTSEDLARSPTWKPPAPPPLDPGAAAAAAHAALADLIDDASSWRTSLVALRAVPGGSDDRWFYVVLLEGPTGLRIEPGVPDIATLKLVVLLNGEVPVPTIERTDSPLPASAAYQSVTDSLFRLAHVRGRSQKADDRFVSYILADEPGDGPTLGPDWRVRVEIAAETAAHPGERRERSLEFTLGSGEVGPAIERAVESMVAGGTRTVRVREEVAAGVRELWSELPEESQILVELRLVEALPPGAS